MSATAGEAASGAFRVNSLSNLDTASAKEGRVVWDWPRSLWNMAMFAGAMMLGPIFSVGVLWQFSLFWQASHCAWGIRSDSTAG